MKLWIALIDHMSQDQGSKIIKGKFPINVPKLKMGSKI